MAYYLPPEVWASVLSFVDIPTLSTVARVCYLFGSLVPQSISDTMDRNFKSLEGLWGILFDAFILHDRRTLPAVATIKFADTKIGAVKGKGRSYHLTADRYTFIGVRQKDKLAMLMSFSHPFACAILLLTIPHVVNNRSVTLDGTYSSTVVRDLDDGKVICTKVDTKAEMRRYRRWGYDALTDITEWDSWNQMARQNTTPEPTMRKLLGTWKIQLCFTIEEESFSSSHDMVIHKYAEFGIKGTMNGSPLTGMVIGAAINDDGILSLGIPIHNTYLHLPSTWVSDFVVQISCIVSLHESKKSFKGSAILGGGNFLVPGEINGEYIPNEEMVSDPLLWAELPFAQDDDVAYL